MLCTWLFPIFFFFLFLDKGNIVFISTKLVLVSTFTITQCLVQLTRSQKMFLHHPHNFSCTRNEKKKINSSWLFPLFWLKPSQNCNKVAWLLAFQFISFHMWVSDLSLNVMSFLSPTCLIQEISFMAWFQYIIRYLYFCSGV